MRKTLTLAMLGLMAGTSLVMTVGCADGQQPEDMTWRNADAKSSAEQAKQERVAGSGDATTAGGSTNGEPAAAVTPEAKSSRFVGDAYTAVEESKSWGASQAEPQQWQSRSSTEHEILKFYAADQRCRYREKSTMANLRVPTNALVYSESDIGCTDEAPACGQAPSCETSDLSAENVGEFASSRGQRVVCTEVVCNGTGRQSIIRTESQIWRHDRAIAPDNIVRRLDRSCRMDLRSSDAVASFRDPCDYNAGRSVAYKKSTFEVTSQRRGTSVGTLSQYAPRATLDLNGSPARGNASLVSASCSIAGPSRISITLERRYCDSSAFHYEKLELRSVDITRRRTANTNVFAVPRDDVRLGYDFAGVPTTNVPICPARTTRTYRLPMAAACEVTLSGKSDEGVLMGTGRCSAPLSWYNGQTRLQEEIEVREYSFTCTAPKDFDYSVLRP